MENLTLSRSVGYLLVYGKLLGVLFVTKMPKHFISDSSFTTAFYELIHLLIYLQNTFELYMTRLQRSYIKLTTLPRPPSRLGRGFTGETPSPFPTSSIPSACRLRRLVSDATPSASLSPTFKSLAMLLLMTIGAQR